MRPPLASTAVTALAVMLFASAAAPVRAEIRLVVPTPRTTMDGLTLFPCGTIPRSATPTRFAAGQSLTVTWQETTDRDGSYAIALSLAGDRNFDYVLADAIADRAGGGSYSQLVTLPDVSCTDCTLQLAQLTTDGTPPTTYYSCADLVITAPVGADAGTAPGSDAGAGPGPGSGGDSGCGCTAAGTAPDSPRSLVVMLGFAGLAWLRRRSRR